MNIEYWIFAFFFLCLFFSLPAQAQTNPYAGLWVGQMTLDQVSDANPTVSDLSFDMSLDGVLVEETFISLGASWRYEDTGVNQDTAWREVGFDDAGWSNGAASFGYGEATNVLNTLIVSNHQPTVYFRNTFLVADPTAYSTLSFRLLRDDAAVVYLNGALILRSNISPIYNFNTLALSVIDGDEETNFVEITVPATALAGTNVVAVEIHQATTNDTDLRFDLELTATRTETPPTTFFPIQSAWNYLVTNALPATNWTALGFDDTSWSNSAAEFGYGDGDEATVIGFGASTNKNKTTYFRKTFVVNNPVAHSHLDMFIRRDDGAVVYVNGLEVLRSNMPEEEPITYDTDPVVAIGAEEEVSFLLQRVSDPGLVSGTNVVAVEIHQHPSELGEVNVGIPSPTPAIFDLRLIVHVETNGTPRFLKDVIQLWQDGTTQPATSGPPGALEVDVPGRFVLITDEDLISTFKGSALRDGEPVGLRISSAFFDFDGDYLDVNGAFDPSNGVLTVTNTLPSAFRTHPFRHKFHPDHDNLDAQYLNFKEEAPEITRSITLNFLSRYPPNPLLATNIPPPGWGRNRVGGIYRETVTGLHKNDIQTEGPFELERVNFTGVLNE